MAKTATITYPEELAASLELSDEQVQRELGFMAAAKLYELGRVSASQAAEIAGLRRQRWKPRAPKPFPGTRPSTWRRERSWPPTWRLPSVTSRESLTVTRAGIPVAELRPLRRPGLDRETLIERWRRLPPVDLVAFRRDVDAVVGTSV